MIEIDTDASGYTTTTVTASDSEGNVFVTTINDDDEVTTSVTSSDADGNTIEIYTDESGDTYQTITTTDDEGNSISITTSDGETVVAVSINDSEQEIISSFEYSSSDEGTIIYVVSDVELAVVDSEGEVDVLSDNS